jgi:hypothetical protein
MKVDIFIKCGIVAEEAFATERIAPHFGLKSATWFQTLADLFFTQISSSWEGS